MLDHIEELIEFVNNYRLNNDDEAHGNDEGTRQYSNDELIKLLESDTSIVEENQEAENFTEKTTGNDLESEDVNSVLKVDNCVKGLTMEIRKSLCSKFNTALSINYKTIFKNQNMTLTDANISDIARKLEFSILSISEDLNSYKLSGAEKVINIEKQTCNRNLCEALRAEMELLKLRDQIQTAETTDNPEQPSTTVEAETIPHEKSQCQDDQSNTNIAMNTGDGTSLDVSTLKTVASESDDYCTCTTNSRSPTESQQNCESCTSNSNTQDPVVNVADEKTLKEAEPSTTGDCQCVSTTESIFECINNNCSEKSTIETSNLLSEIHSNIVKDEFNLAINDENSLNRKRKRTSESDVESTIQDNKENIDIIDWDADTQIESSPPSKKHKTTISEMNAVTPDTTTSEETQENVKLEANDIKSECLSPPADDKMCISYRKETVSLENSLSNQIPPEKCDSSDRDENMICSGVKIELQAEPIKSETVSQDQSLDGIDRARLRAMIKIKHVTEWSAIDSDNTESSDDHYYDIGFKKESVNSVHEDSSNILNDNNILQNPEIDYENDSTCSGLDTEDRALENVDALSDTSTLSGLDLVYNNRRENNVVVERTCLIDEKVFEEERARLDKEYEKIKKRKEEEEEMKKKKSQDRDFIYGDYQGIFEIIIPIMREYYPSDYIPEAWHYGKILQRLQIDLAEMNMTDEQMASYTRSSIETMRYLCDHCITQ